MTVDNDILLATDDELKLAVLLMVQKAIEQKKQVKKAVAEVDGQ